MTPRRYMLGAALCTFGAAAMLVGVIASERWLECVGLGLGFPVVIVGMVLTTRWEQP